MAYLNLLAIHSRLMLIEMSEKVPKKKNYNKKDFS